MPSFIIDPDYESSRIDVYIAQQLPGLSRSYIKQLCSTNKVELNGKVTNKASVKVHPGNEVSVDYSKAEATAIPKISLEVLYEDADCIAVVKPVGLLTHSKGEFNPEATVATYLADKTIGLDSDRNGIVHRLDRVTSGVLIGAKNPKALELLQKQFADRKTVKTYLAIVTGTLNPSKAIVDMPIERNPKKPQTFRAGPNGKPAQTMYEVIEANGTYSLLRLLPKTGRTHQLRVHMSQLGHPIVGDTLYGGKAAPRVFLHALSLEITIPSGKTMTFTAPEPPEFKSYMES